MTPTPPPRLTPARRAWLERLEREGVVARRGRGGRAGYDCARAGWAEWACSAGGEVIGVAELRRRFNQDPDDLDLPADWRICGETLTPAGRAVLAEARAAERRGG